MELDSQYAVKDGINEISNDVSENVSMQRFNKKKVPLHDQWTLFLNKHHQMQRKKKASQ